MISLNSVKTSTKFYDVSENRIIIILPVTEIDTLDLSKDELFIYNLLKEGLELNRKEIDLKTNFEKSKTLRILNSLEDKNIVVKIGSGTAININ